MLRPEGSISRTTCWAGRGDPLWHDVRIFSSVSGQGQGSAEVRKPTVKHYVTRLPDTFFSALRVSRARFVVDISQEPPNFFNCSGVCPNLHGWRPAFAAVRRCPVRRTSKVTRMRNSRAEPADQWRIRKHTRVATRGRKTPERFSVWGTASVQGFRVQVQREWGPAGGALATDPQLNSVFVHSGD